MKAPLGMKVPSEKVKGPRTTRGTVTVGRNGGELSYMARGE